MPKYHYVVSNLAGVKSEGSFAASNVDAARRKLEEPGRIIISITEEKKSDLNFFTRPHLSFQDKMIFVKHLATMVKVGITITESMEILINQTKEKSKRRMYESILEMVKSGQTLAKSLKAYNYIFSDLFINMIGTGEESGTLEKTLEYLDLQLEKEAEIRKKVISAFIYPAVIISITLILAVGIMVFIMPKITKIFVSMKIKLPWITQTLIDMSDFIINKPIITAAMFVGVIVLIVMMFKLKYLKPFWHKVFLHIPVFGRILVASNLARFARTMNSLLQTGVPVTEALGIIANMIDNNMYKQVIREARDKVEQGGKLGEAFDGHEKLFPMLATRMLFIGEKTGSLETTTETLAKLYEHDVDNLTKNLSVLLEPLLLVFMAGLIGGIALSIILPIYQLPQLISK